MKEPDKLLLRKKDILVWTGITADEYEVLVESNVIRGVQFRTNGRQYFYKEHIREKLITPAIRAAGEKI